MWLMWVIWVMRLKIAAAHRYREHPFAFYFRTHEIVYFRQEAPDQTFEHLKFKTLQTLCRQLLANISLCEHLFNNLTFQFSILTLKCRLCMAVCYVPLGGPKCGNVRLQCSFAMFVCNVRLQWTPVSSISNNNFLPRRDSDLVRIILFVLAAIPSSICNSNASQYHAASSRNSSSVFHTR